MAFNAWLCFSTSIVLIGLLDWLATLAISLLTTRREREAEKMAGKVLVK